MNPLISIITINYNNASGLEKTIRSVVDQTFKDFEYLIIDGGSTDGSKNIIEQYAPQINYWVSEPDKGVYNAMNKGIVKATGKYLLFLNSGDELENTNSLHLAHEHLQNEDLIYFDLLVQNTNGEVSLKNYPDHLNFSYFIFESLPHPASFIQKKLFDSIGLYDETLKISSDWAFFILAICKKQCSYKHVPKTISVFHLDGMSSSAQNQLLIRAEKKKMLHEHFLPYENLFDDLWQAHGLRQTFQEFKIIRLFKSFGFFK